MTLVTELEHILKQILKQSGTTPPIQLPITFPTLPALASIQRVPDL